MREALRSLARPGIASCYFESSPAFPLLSPPARPLQKGQPGMVRRAMGAVGGALASAAGAVLPGFRVSKSSAELAGTEEYAEEGLAEHKVRGWGWD